ncbi:MAG: iron ABC transporter permease [Brachybacterium sp.]|nr:iron ABC transporter permease [Brachybacterium sp.]
MNHARRDSAAPLAGSARHPGSARRPDNARRPGPARRAAFVLVPLVVATTLAVLSVALGARSVDLGVVLSALGAFVNGNADAAIGSSMDQAAVIDRIPRVLTALLVGSALAVSGLAMQGATRNPLGDPGLLGLGAGASLAMAIGLGLGLTGNIAVLMMLAILGTLAAAILVYAAASAAGRLTGSARSAPGPLSLVLAGAAVSAGALAVTNALIIAVPTVQDRFRFWSIGTVARSTVTDAASLSWVIILGVVLVFLCAPGLDALALGDEMAHGLGIRPEHLRIVLLGATVLMTAAATALAGPVMFVGLLVPHVLRRLRPPSTRLFVAATALWGGALVLAADLVGRLIVAPSEIHIGVTTVVLGVPVMLLLLRRRSMSL